ncbi:MAG: hypothetical protein QOH39_1616 [Verrucomicrobiota bacterium]|jgi:hypothetical protein
MAAQRGLTKSLADCHGGYKTRGEVISDRKRRDLNQSVIHALAVELHTEVAIKEESFLIRGFPSRPSPSPKVIIKASAKAWKDNRVESSRRFFFT